MFGYIRADKPELKVKEFEMYKSVYCSLCRNLGKNYGFLSRLTLNYDFTFLSMLNLSLQDTCEEIERKRCAFNPLKKCNYCKSASGFDMPCAVAMIMTYYKILDNVKDEKGIKKLFFAVLSSFFKRAQKKAADKYPQIEKIVAEYISTLTQLEKENCTELDKVAHPTANALSEIFMLCSDNAAQKRVLARLGYCMGRYIYILDAVCDLDEDIKHHSYNVFANMPCDSVRERATSQLYFCINEAIKAFELLDIKKYKPILGNIVYSGLEQTLKKELNL